MFIGIIIYRRIHTSIFHQEKLTFSSNFLTSKINFYLKTIDFRGKFVRTYFDHFGLKNSEKTF